MKRPTRMPRPLPAPFALALCVALVPVAASAGPTASAVRPVPAGWHIAGARLDPARVGFTVTSEFDNGAGFIQTQSDGADVAVENPDIATAIPPGTVALVRRRSCHLSPDGALVEEGESLWAQTASDFLEIARPSGEHDQWEAAQDRHISAELTASSQWTIHGSHFRVIGMSDVQTAAGKFPGCVVVLWDRRTAPSGKPDVRHYYAPDVGFVLFELQDGHEWRPQLSLTRIERTTEAKNACGVDAPLR